MVKGIGREEQGLYILKSNSEKSAICGFTTRSGITQENFLNLASFGTEGWVMLP